MVYTFFVCSILIMVKKKALYIYEKLYMLFIGKHTMPYDCGVHKCDTIDSLREKCYMVKEEYPC